MKEEFEDIFYDGTDVSTLDSFNYLDHQGKSSKFDEEIIEESNIEDVKVQEGCLNISAFVLNDTENMHKSEQPYHI